MLHWAPRPKPSDIALKLMEAPESALARNVRCCIMEAGFAIAQNESRLAAAAIDEALLALDEEPEFDRR